MGAIAVEDSEVAVPEATLSRTWPSGWPASVWPIHVGNADWRYGAEEPDLLGRTSAFLRPLRGPG